MKKGEILREKKIGFIGQGFIGKSYSDDFESRGFLVVRYSLDLEYVGNKEELLNCKVVFVAVNAATKPLEGQLRDDGNQKTFFDDSNIKAVIPLTKPGTVIILKSTLPPGKTVEIQKLFPDRKIFHSPEFLTEMTAKDDAKKPMRNIVGVPEMSAENIEIASEILTMFPHSDYQKVLPSTAAELIKYGANAFLFVKILFSNVFYELAEKHGQDWDIIREAIGVDPRITPHHMDLHLKNDPTGVMNRRGAGRSCFIKDMAELSELFATDLPHEKTSLELLRTMEKKNSELLQKFNRYLNILESVYGEKPLK